MHEAYKKVWSTVDKVNNIYGVKLNRYQLASHIIMIYFPYKPAAL